MKPYIFHETTIRDKRVRYVIIEPDAKYPGEDEIRPTVRVEIEQDHVDAMGQSTTLWAKTVSFMVGSSKFTEVELIEFRNTLGPEMELSELITAFNRRMWDLLAGGLTLTHIRGFSDREPGSFDDCIEDLQNVIYRGPVWAGDVLNGDAIRRMLAAGLIDKQDGIEKDSSDGERDGVRLGGYVATGAGRDYYNRYVRLQNSRTSLKSS